MTAHDYLHARIFGVHIDKCPECGQRFRCTEPYDCQRKNLCINCYLKTAEAKLERQFIEEEFGNG